MSESRSMSNNELRHYGVLGMKWGVRKARKQGTTYTYKSHGQKKWEKKLNKAKDKNSSPDKITKAQHQLDTFRNRDKNRQKYAESTSVGKTIAKGLLMGPFGSGNYNRLRAAGHTRFYSAMGSDWITSTLALPYQLIITKDEEFTKAR